MEEGGTDGGEGMQASYSIPILKLKCVILILIFRPEIMFFGRSQGFAEYFGAFNAAWQTV